MLGQFRAVEIEARRLLMFASYQRLGLKHTYVTKPLVLSGITTSLLRQGSHIALISPL